MTVVRLWWVYVIQSQKSRGNKPGFFYVGCTTDPARRLRQHNGEIKGGGKWTSKHRPWRMRALFGPYRGQSNALKAEYALKHSKRGRSRCYWSSHDSPWCRGLGVEDPRVAEINASCTSSPAPTPATGEPEPRKV